MRDGLESLLASLAIIAAAIAAGLGLRVLQGTYKGHAESFVLAVLVGLIALFAIVLPVAVWQGRRRNAPGVPALAVATVVVAGLLAVYFFRASYFVMFPADILIWSESDYVNDILKLQVGYPVYSEQVNNDSLFYTPGSQLLTFLLATLTGTIGSIPAYRIIQVAYTVGAAVVAVQCWRIVVRYTGGPAGRDARPWTLLTAALLLLFATNQITNSFNQFMHNDALAQLISVAAYWLLLKYALDGWRGALWLMVMVPAAGFFVKQSLVIWAGIYVGYLLIFDRPRSWSRIVLLALASIGFVGALVGIGFAVWGPPFRYWVFDVLSARSVNPLRSVQHMLEAWAYFAIGLVGGWVLVRRESQAELLGVWLVALGLLTVETYTSGVAWMLNHMGPGSLMVGIWFAAALPRLSEAVGSAESGWIARHLRPALAAGVLLLLLQGLGAVRIPLTPLGADADRYVRNIETEFAGEDPQRVLMDVGTWPYLESRSVMRDRAPSIGERGYSQTGDFSGILGRLSRQEYDKILVRGYQSEDFWYDHASWPVSSGIRAALQKYYTVDHVIPPIEIEGPQTYRTYSFGEISVLVPRDVN